MLENNQFLHDNGSFGKTIQLLNHLYNAQLCVFSFYSPAVYPEPKLYAELARKPTTQYSLPAHTTD